MFGFAKDHQPCVIFMDEVDAIGGSRFSEGTSADREIQRTLMEFLNQFDGFEQLGQVKMVMATNRPDILDPALLRPGRLDRKIEIPLPNEAARLDILKIHAGPITKSGEIDYESVCKLADGFNGADLRNVCTEAGLFAIRSDRDYVLEEDFMKAARKIAEVKKLESKAEYAKLSGNLVRRSWGASRRWRTGGTSGSGGRSRGRRALKCVNCATFSSTAPRGSRVTPCGRTLEYLS